MYSRVDPHLPMTPSSIQARLSRWIAIQAFLGLSILCGLVYSVTYWSFSLKQEQEFTRHKDLVLHLLDEPGILDSGAVLQHKLNDFFRSHDDVAIEIKKGNQLLYRSITTPPGLPGWIERTATLRPSNFTEPIEVRFAIDIRADLLLLQRLAWTLMVAVVLGSTIIAVTGVLLIRKGLRSLSQLAEETSRTGPGHVGRRIDTRQYDAELQPWIEQFNALLSRVERAHEQLIFFNADVAHEMRTPLANLISETEVVLSKPRDHAEIRDALLSSLEEARRLSAIVTDMLFLSQADRGALAQRSDTVELAEQAQLVIDYHEDSLEASGLETRIAGAGRARVDAALVRRAMSNLLANAIRYARPGSVVVLQIDAQDGVSVWISVVNEGSPIDAADLPKLFERFFRGERSRAGSQEHHGLGLAIVSAVARMHNGKTRALSAGAVTEIGFSIAMSSEETGAEISQITEK